MTDVRLLFIAEENTETRRIQKHFPAGSWLHVSPLWLEQGNSFCWRETGTDSVLEFNELRVDASVIRSAYYSPGARLNPSGLIEQGPLKVSGLLDDAYAEFGLEETVSGFVGGLLTLPVRWMNHPLHGRNAEYKLPQLAMARALGLRVPRTCVSSDPDRLRDFWAENDGRVITKNVSSYSGWKISERIAAITRQVHRHDLEGLVLAPRIPTLFQEMIPAAVDLRVTVVGEEVYAAAIHSQQGASTLDWRFDYTVPMTKFTLDESVESALRSMMRDLGLTYGAADFRVTPEGEYVFLEINPAGIFEFVEELAGHPISSSIAGWLLQK
ncbi:hypothetical protein [Herbidospora yilanensis]|uniref:hypothetical protein n=1 Tax=Herbidospora yilanensis TaxID=354426 RepID=UPI0007822C7A|nr:hypothetical protein [Herbidospora yilanensis]